MKEIEKIINEGGDGYCTSTGAEEAYVLEAQSRRASWTLEATATRRSSWNAELAKAKKAGRKINLPEMEAKLGFCLADLKRAIVRHKL